MEYGARNKIAAEVTSIISWSDNLPYSQIDLWTSAFAGVTTHRQFFSLCRKKLELRNSQRSKLMKVAYIFSS